MRPDANAGAGRDNDIYGNGGGGVGGDHALTVNVYRCVRERARVCVCVGFWPACQDFRIHIVVLDVNNSAVDLGTGCARDRPNMGLYYQRRR